MEIPVLAELGGTVTAVSVAEGDVVQEGDVMVELDLTPKGWRVWPKGLRSEGRSLPRGDL